MKRLLNWLEKPIDLLLWQPVTNGATHLAQFLRLYSAAKILGAAKASNKMQMPYLIFEGLVKIPKLSPRNLPMEKSIGRPNFVLVTRTLRMRGRAKVRSCPRSRSKANRYQRFSTQPK